VGAGRASDVVGNVLPVLRDSRNRPFIPGASLKGAFRARIEALLRSVLPTPPEVTFPQLDRLTEAIRRAGDNSEAIDVEIAQMLAHRAVLDFQQIEDRTRAIGQFKQHEDNRNLTDAQLSQVIYRCSSMIDLTFGSPDLAGRIFFKDAQVNKDFWFETFEVRNGVAINRDTETVEGSLLYDYEVVPAGTRFDFALTLEHAADWQLGMVLLILGAWQNDGIQIGGFRSRGLGYITLTDVQYDYRVTHPGDVDSALRMVCDHKTLAALGLEPGSDTIDKTGWISAFRDRLIALAKQETSDA
ncbi:MAG: hypothetical protein HGA65_20335, partial [Oscillochloris sp.]|nr:hypothetical protein [Oscillochloris sp.]